MKITINSVQPIMEDKALLTIEEKKQLWKDLGSFKMPVSILENDNILKGVKEIQDSCKPLFHTSIDNVPVWRTDSVWYNKDGIATEFVIPETESYTLDGRKSASTREACERYLADSIMVNLSSVVSRVIELYATLECPTKEELIYFEKIIKEELSKLT